MKTITVQFPGLDRVNGHEEFELATNLRVAYKVQGYHNHKSYIAIFEEIDSLGVDQQIDIIYAAFSTANPEMTKDVTKQRFMDYFLDEFDTKYLMQLLKEVIQGIMGVTEEDLEKKRAEKEQQGNQEAQE